MSAIRENSSDPSLAMIAILCAVVLTTGCERHRQAESKDKAATATAGAVESREYWDVYFLKNKRIGYGRSTVKTRHESGRELIETDSLNHLIVKRENDTTEQDIITKSVETADGKLLSFECEMHMGKTPIRTTGKVENGRLVFTTSGGGATGQRRSSIPWKSEYLGPVATEQTLARRPMQPGERRELTMLMTGFNQTAEVELEAKKFEPTELLDGKRELLRIETVSRLGDGQKIDCTLWSDRAGEVLKTDSRLMGLQTYRVSKSRALEKADVAELDLLTSSIVPVDRPLAAAHRTKRVKYRVRLDGGDPAAVFADDLSQAVKSIDAHTAEITVFAVRPDGKNVNPNARDEKPSEDDLKSNGFIDCDDPLIAADAKKAAGDETDQWRTAVALEKYVNREVKNKNFSQAFATASEVAKTREGDCTEHAVFLAALCRARKIPARVAIGLVYVQGQNAFGYHLWTEAYIGGRWVPLDGTLAMGGTGAGHLKICTSTLKDASAYNAFLPVAQILGRLKIEVIQAEQDDGTTTIPGRSKPCPIFMKRMEALVVN